ncbi:copia protein [Tanacetum coccineum]
MAFVSSSNNNTSNSNEAVNVAHGVTSASTQVNTAYSTNIDNLSDAIICSFFDSQPKRKLTVNGNKTIDFDKSKVECYNCHKREHFAKECRAPRNQDKKNKESSRRSSDQAEEGPNYALMAYSSSSSDSELIECQTVDNCKKGLGYENYNAVPPPYTGNFMPSTPDLSFTGLDEFVNELVVENCKAMSSEEEPKVIRKSDDALIIEEQVSDSKEENVSQTKTKKKQLSLVLLRKSLSNLNSKKNLLGKLLNKLRNIGKTLIVQEAIKEIGTI